MAFPTTLDTLSTTRGTTGQPMNSPNHITHHTAEDTAIQALEAKVGIDGSAVTTSHDYKLSGVATGDKAVSKTGTETLTNKTLTSPVINVGSDATGDIYYRNASGLFTRLGIGTSGQILSVSSSGIPEWIANPSASDASTTVKGVVEIATTAQITAGTGAGETGALLVVPASAVGSAGASKLVQYTAAGLYPAADGSLITNVTPSTATKINITTTDFVANSAITTEQTALTVAIPANTLGSNNGVQLRLYIDTWESAGGASTTIRIKYGATTLHSNALTPAAAGNQMHGFIDFILLASGATNAQESTLNIDMHQTDVTTNTTAPTGIKVKQMGSAAIDSTSSQNLVVTIQFSGSTTLTIKNAIVTKIY
jgi:hypothetical protein